MSLILQIFLNRAFSRHRSENCQREILKPTLSIYFFSSGSSFKAQKLIEEQNAQFFESKMSENKDLMKIHSVYVYKRNYHFMWYKYKSASFFFKKILISLLFIHLSV